MPLGKRIEQVLAEKNWKQADLLRAAPKVSQAALSMLIQRDSGTSEYLFEIADALNVSARWLLTGVGAPHIQGNTAVLSPKVKRIAEHIAALPDERLNALSVLLGIKL